MAVYIDARQARAQVAGYIAARQERAQVELHTARQGRAQVVSYIAARQARAQVELRAARQCDRKWSYHTCSKADTRGSSKCKWGVRAGVSYVTKRA